jgi:hypothetical protein
LPPSAAFQQSVTWWQSERGLIGFAFSLGFSRSVSVEGTQFPVQSGVVLPSGFFPVSPAFLTSQTSIDSGEDSPAALNVWILVGITVGGLVIIVVIITLVIFLCCGRIRKQNALPHHETLIEEPETVDTNSAFWEFSQDFTATTEWRTDTLS